MFQKKNIFVCCLFQRTIMFSRSSIPFKVYSTVLCGGVLIAKKTAYVQILWGPKNVETLSILDSSGNLRERKKYMKK